MENFEARKFCGICKLPNERDAAVCVHCGARFEVESPVAGTTNLMEERRGVSPDLQERITRQLAPPPEGMAIFMMDKTEPFSVMKDQEFVIGRASELTDEPLVDLTHMDGFAMGVSRRHAMIRASGKKYLVVDLNSSNGTWLNGVRLVPSKPYDLYSGSVLQLGRMRLVVIYVAPSESLKSK